jgi:hypothetical protein
VRWLVPIAGLFVAASAAHAQDADFVPEAFRDATAVAPTAPGAGVCEPDTLTCVFVPGEGAAETRTHLDRDAIEQLLTLTTDETRLIGVAPGGLLDDFGIGFGGATSFENRFVLDGLDVGAVRWGGRASPLPPLLLSSLAVRRAQGKTFGDRNTNCPWV